MRDAYVVVASNRGSASHPTRYYNLSAKPRVVIEVGGEPLRVHTVTAKREESTRPWAEIVEHYPNFKKYQEEVSRELPVVLRPASYGGDRMARVFRL